MRGMTDGYCKGVRGVERLYLVPDGKQRVNHHLNLVLFRASISDDTHLHFERRVLADIQPGFCCEEQRHASHMRQLQGGLCVHGMKYFFNRDGFRSEGLHHAAQLDGNRSEPVLQMISWFRANDAGRDQSMRMSIRIDDTEAGFFGSAIDSDDSHPKKAVPGVPVSLRLGEVVALCYASASTSASSTS